LKGEKGEVLAQVQRGLEGLYRIETDLHVGDYVIDEATRDQLGVARAPREQLLMAETGGELEVALYVDPRTLDNLAAHDPRESLGDHNLQDFLHAVEGVSHFVYVAWRARRGRPVSPFELELQAEIDKYVTCLLTMWPQPPSDLRLRLFDHFELEPGMDEEERSRYLAANSNARAYAASLESRFVARAGVPDMLAELRRFYRLGAQEKLDHIQVVRAA
jgi:hypothetical protein